MLGKKIRRVDIVDNFTIASGKRLIQLNKIVGQAIQKPWLIEVFMQRTDQKPVLISTSEYITEEAARQDFEARRPKMREETVDMPMQKGKRLIQEVFGEKLK